jgi:hypothetical protein
VRCRWCVRGLVADTQSERSFGRPWPNAFDLSQACDRVVIGKTTQLELGESAISKTLRELTHGTGLLTSQAELTERLHVDRCKLVGVRRRSSKALKQADENRLVEDSFQESLAGDDAVLVMRTLTTAYLQITEAWGDVIKTDLDVAAHDDEYANVLATAQRRHNRNLSAICRHLENVGALRGDVDARTATRIITHF